MFKFSGIKPSMISLPSGASSIVGLGESLEMFIHYDIRVTACSSSTSGKASARW